MEDKVTLRGDVLIIARDSNGNEKDRREIRNLVVTTGKEGVIDQLAASPSIGVPKYIAVGKSSTEAKAVDTALGEELKRKEATTRTRSSKTLTMAVVFAAGEGTGAWKEAGILTASSGGTLYSRTVFEVMNKEAGDSFEVVWKLTAE